jgi:DNA-binding XRE family transcriptional regulator
MSSKDVIRRRGVGGSNPAQLLTQPGEERSVSDRVPTAQQVVKLGVPLKRIREKSGMSLRAVARQLGVVPFMSQLENGKSQPSVATLYSLTQLLDVSIDELFAADQIEADSAAGSRGGSRAASVGLLDNRAAAAGGSSTSRSDLGSPADAWPPKQALERLSVTRPGMRHRLEMDSGVNWEQLANKLALVDRVVSLEAVVENGFEPLAGGTARGKILVDPRHG